MNESDWVDVPADAPIAPVSSESDWVDVPSAESYGPQHMDFSKFLSMSQAQMLPKQPSNIIGLLKQAALRTADPLGVAQTGATINEGINPIANKSYETFAEPFVSGLSQEKIRSGPMTLADISPLLAASRLVSPKQIGEVAGRVVTDPRTYIGAEMGTGLAKYGMRGIAKGGKKLGDIITSGRKLKNAQSVIGSLQVRGEQLTQDLARAKSAYDKAMDSLHGASVTDAQAYKTALPELSKANSKVYKTGLDIAEGKLSENQASVKKMVDEALQEAFDEGISTGTVVDKLKELSKKLSPTSEEVFDYATLGNKSVVTNKPVSVSELKNIKNEIYKLAKQSGDSADEVASAIYFKHYGNKVASIDKDFAVMNAEYRPYAEAKNWAYRVFRPKTNEEITFGEQVLKRIAKGQGQQKDYDYLKLLEEGSGRFKGTGNLRKSSTSISDELKNLDNQIEQLRVRKVKSTKGISETKVLVQKLESLKRQRNWIAAGAIAGLLGVSTKGKSIIKGTTDVLS